MNQFLEKLRNLVVQKIEIVHDYFQIYFEDGSVLNIYNKYSYSKGNCNIKDIKGFLNGIEETGKEIVLFFSDDSRLAIDLRDEAYSYPEAVLLTTSDGKMIVWN